MTTPNLVTPPHRAHTPRTAVAARGGHVDDTGLLRRIAAQENDAFTVLYNRYAPRLLCFLTRRLGQRALAEEVCHDVLLTVWQQAKHYDPAIPFAPWLFGIARNKALSAFRSAKPSHAAPSAPLDQDAADDPETSMLHHEHANAVVRTLATLPLAQQAVVDLAYYHDCAHSAIAARLGCPVGTVKTRMAQARRRLLPVLTELGLAPPSSTVAQRQRPTRQDRRLHCTAPVCTKLPSQRRPGVASQQAT